MKKHYYVIGTTFGLLAAIGLALFISAGELKGMFTRWEMLVPILSGALAALLLGYKADLEAGSASPRLFRTIGSAAGIFLAGVIVGVMVNVLVNGFVFNWIHGAHFAILPLITGPLFWLCVVGLPASVIVASLYFGAAQWLRRSAE